MLRMCKVQPVPAEAPENDVQVPVEEPFKPYDPWEGKEVIFPTVNSDNGINEIWIPPSPPKPAEQEPPPPERWHERLFRDGARNRQSRSQSRDSREPCQRPGSRPNSATRRSLPPSTGKQSLQVPSGPSSSCTSRASSRGRHASTASTAPSSADATP